MSTTKIEWTDATWNPVTGCSRISAGCAHCYAEAMTRRLTAMGVAKYRGGFMVATHEDALNEPRRWRKPRTIFVCSMSDLFHKDVPFEFIDKVMAVIKETPQHRYQLLTKRAERMEEYFKSREVPQNVWIGVTVEVQSSKGRIQNLRNIQNAPIRFLSCEPLLEDLGTLDLDEDGYTGSFNWLGADTKITVSVEYTPYTKPLGHLEDFCRECEKNDRELRRFARENMPDRINKDREKPLTPEEFARGLTMDSIVMYYDGDYDVYFRFEKYTVNISGDRDGPRDIWQEVG